MKENKKIFGVEYSKNFGSILQIDCENGKRFVITAFDEKSNTNKLYCYGDNKDGKIELFRVLKINSLNLEDIKINDKNYLVESENYGGKIYNIELDRLSDFFDIVFESETDEKILVSKNIVDSRIGKINDVISYEIDLNTLKIISPIWSDLQQRYINLYSEKEMKNKKTQSLKNSDYAYYTDDNATTTINFEVKKYLDIIANHFNQIEDYKMIPVVYDADEATFKEYVKK